MVSSLKPERIDPLSSLTPADLGIGRLFWAIADAVIVADTETSRIVLWNPAAEQIFGYTSDEVVGLPLEVLVPERLKERHQEGMARYRATGRGRFIGTGTALEAPALRKTGEEIVVELMLSPIEDAPVSGRFVLAVVRDVTERKRSEEQRIELAREQAARAAAEKAAEQLRRLHTVTEAALAHLRLDDLLDALLGRIIELLAADTAAVFLLEGEELVARAARGLEEEVERGVRIPLSSGLFAGRIAAERRAIAIHNVEQAEVAPFLRKKGIKSLLGVPLLVEGRAIGVLHIGTLRRRRFTAEDSRLLRVVADRAALAIEHSSLYEDTEADRARLAFVAEASQVLASSLDYEATLADLARLAVPRVADWCVVDILAPDGSLRRLAAVHADPTTRDVARELQRRFPPDPNAPYGVPRVLRTGKPELYTEITDALLVQITHDAEHLALLRSLGLRSGMCVPLVARERTLGALTFAVAESGRRYGAVDLALAEDLARRAALALDNAALYRQAQDAIRARDHFLSIASHELRTPVTTIKGTAQLLRRVQRRGQLDAEKLTRHLDALNAASDRMTTLTEDLLDISRLQTGQLTLRPRSFDLAALVRTVTERHQEQAGAQHRFTVDLSCEPCPIVADSDRVEQVLANLLVNAVKYSPNGGAVHVALQTSDDGVLLAVRDEGIGLPPGAAETIFAPFGRAENAIRENLPGMGLGLYISRQIAECHGGRLWAESEGEGRGTTMYLRLPNEASR